MLIYFLRAHPLSIDHVRDNCWAGAGAKIPACKRPLNSWCICLHGATSLRRTHCSDVRYFNSPTVPDRYCFATGRRGLHIIYPCRVVRYMTRCAVVGNPNIILIAARLHYKRTVQETTRYSNIPYHTFTRYVKLVWWRKLRQDGLFAEGARG